MSLTVDAVVVDKLINSLIKNINNTTLENKILQDWLQDIQLIRKIKEE